MPKPELEKALARNHKHNVLNSYAGLIVLARPWWAKDNRQRRHREIAAKAVQAQVAMPERIGPYPLIYADPPWQFDVYAETGLARSADQHYPTLTDDEIRNYKIGNLPISEIAAPRAALFLWCTSSNMPRALAVIEAWGFTFSTSAVWVKNRPGDFGTGYVFRNRHELLLYGTRGGMSAPQYAPESVFEFPTTGHSAKPPEIRAIIEKMYPDFDHRTRAELFARTTERIPGWTCYGFEAFAGIEDAA
jgi:N6-adenosine-specific RNA methylase IME4